MPEIIPVEPDPDNAGVGNKQTFGSWALGSLISGQEHFLFRVFQGKEKFSYRFVPD
jgi:hypothetical protein